MYAVNDVPDSLLFPRRNSIDIEFVFDEKAKSSSLAKLHRQYARGEPLTGELERIWDAVQYRTAAIQ